MSSKLLGGLRGSAAVVLIAGGLTMAAAGVACADSQSVERADARATSVAESGQIKAPDQGPLEPVTVSGAAAGNDAAVTVTTDETAVVVSGRAHVESPLDQAAGGVVHHDDSGRRVGVASDQLGFAGGATGDSSSVDVVGTGRIGAEKHYHSSR